MFNRIPSPSTHAKLSRCFCLAVATIALFAAASAWSQTTYKCGSSYSQNPCEGGVALDIDDKRSAEQKKQALNATQSDKQAAAKLEKERLGRDKRETVDLKKANAARKKATEKANKTTFSPIKNKPVKVEPTAPADKPADKLVQKGKPKKDKAEIGKP